MSLPLCSLSCSGSLPDGALMSCLCICSLAYILCGAFLCLTCSLVSLCLCPILACLLIRLCGSLALVHLGNFFSISGQTCFNFSINGKLYVFRPQRRLYLRRTTVQEMGSSMRGSQSFVSFMIRIPFPQMLIQRQFLDCLYIPQQDSPSLGAAWHLRRCTVAR